MTSASYLIAPPEPHEPKDTIGPVEKPTIAAKGKRLSTIKAVLSERASALIIAIGLVLAAYCLGGRYETVSIGNGTMVTDRLTGTVKFCYPGGCIRLPNSEYGKPS